MKKTKITIFSSGLNIGGAERVSINLAIGFSKFGYDVDLLILNKNIINENLFLSDKNINIKSLRASKARYAFFKLSLYLLKNQPTYFIATQNYLSLITYPISVIFIKTKFCFREANNPYLNKMNNNIIINKVLNFFIQFIYKSSKYIVAPSIGVKDKMEKFYNIKSKVTVINNPVNIDMIITESKKLDPKYDKFFNIPCIINVGRLDKQKNHALLIDAFYLVSKEYKCNLIIVGRGKEKNNLNILIKKYNLENNVFIFEKINNPFALILKSTLFVLTSDYEGFPNSILEALTLGLPVISTDCECGPREILENGKYGTLIKNNDLNQLKDNILKYLNKDNNENYSDIISQKYNINKIAKEYLNLLNK